MLVLQHDERLDLSVIHHVEDLPDPGLAGTAGDIQSVRAALADIAHVEMVQFVDAYIAPGDLVGVETSAHIVADIDGGADIIAITLGISDGIVRIPVSGTAVLGVVGEHHLYAILVQDLLIERDGLAAVVGALGIGDDHPSHFLGKLDDVLEALSAAVHSAVEGQAFHTALHELAPYLILPFLRHIGRDALVAVSRDARSHVGLDIVEAKGTRKVDTFEEGVLVESVELNSDLPAQLFGVGTAVSQPTVAVVRRLHYPV